MFLICAYELKVEFTGHTKAVSCVSIEPTGNRVVTGALDYNLKIYDYGGMDKYDTRPHNLLCAHVTAGATGLSSRSSPRNQPPSPLFLIPPPVINSLSRYRQCNQRYMTVRAN